MGNRWAREDPQIETRMFQEQPIEAWKFEEMLRAIRPQALVVARVLCVTLDDADDLLQDASLEGFRARGSFIDSGKPDSFLAWFLGIVRNLHRHKMDRMARRKDAMVGATTIREGHPDPNWRKPFDAVDADLSGEPEPPSAEEVLHEVAKRLKNSGPRPAECGADGPSGPNTQIEVPT